MFGGSFVRVSVDGFRVYRRFDMLVNWEKRKLLVLVPLSLSGTSHGKQIMSCDIHHKSSPTLAFTCSLGLFVRTENVCHSSQASGGYYRIKLHERRGDDARAMREVHNVKTACGQRWKRKGKAGPDQKGKTRLFLL